MQADGGMVDRTWLLMELMARGPAPGMFYVLLVPVRHQGVALSSQWPTCLTSALTQDGAASGSISARGGGGRPGANWVQPLGS
jgi:hypothetical protein